MEKENIKELLSFIADTGFIWGPSPEIYGGLAGFYDYGPMGKLLKNRVENTIRKVFINNDYWEVECPTIMPATVWKASGHLGGFTDPLIKDVDGNVYRVDKLIEEWCENNNEDASKLGIEGGSKEHLLKIIKDKGIKAPNGKDLQNEIKDHSLMLKTEVGIDTEAYNRPETATTTYLPFRRYDDFFRKTYPFGVFQIGKAYRNEISPRQNVLRGREFTQAEAQLFLFEDQKNNFERYERDKENSLPLQFNDSDEVKDITLKYAVEEGKLKNKAYAWTLNLAYQLFLSMGIPKERIRMRQHAEDERAFYAEDAWDLEIKLDSYGWYEICGIHDRTNYDLTQHAQHSQEKLQGYNENSNQKETPHIVEIAFGTDRPTFALLDIFFEKQDEKTRVLRLPRKMAPIQVGVFPLVNKLNDKAKEVHDQVKEDFLCQYDNKGSIGKRYARSDEKGIPICVTVDFEEDGKVTLRDRDTAKQVRVKKENVNSKIREFLEGKSLEELEE